MSMNKLDTTIVLLIMPTRPAEVLGTRRRTLRTGTRSLEAGKRLALGASLVYAVLRPAALPSLSGGCSCQVTVYDAQSVHLGFKTEQRRE
jgi:hypothetical protein